MGLGGYGRKSSSPRPMTSIRGGERRQNHHCNNDTKTLQVYRVLRLRLILFFLRVVRQLQIVRSMISYFFSLFEYSQASERASVEVSALDEVKRHALDANSQRTACKLEHSKDIISESTGGGEYLSMRKKIGTD